MRVLFMTRRQAGVATEQIVAARLREAAAVWKLVAGGTLREIHFCATGRNGEGAPTVVGLLECDGLAAARAALAALPMAREGLIEFDCYALAPYDQFGLLFRDEFKA